MTKKTALIWVFVVEAVAYLFLFVGLPTLESLITCPTCNARELMPSSLKLISYFIPGFVGLLMLLVIWRKKEVKDE